jgi:hypothetical protein
MFYLLRFYRPDLCSASYAYKVLYYLFLYCLLNLNIAKAISGNALEVLDIV